MKIQWNGHWPENNQYPPNGTLIKYTKKEEIKTSRIKMVWCGIEPVIELENGDSIIPSLDEFEVIKEP